MLFFEPVETLDRKNYREQLKRCGFFTPSCEYAYANLYAYAALYQTAWAQTDEGLFLRMKNGASYRYLCPIAPEGSFDAAVKRLKAHAVESGEAELCFLCLPKSAVERLSVGQSQMAVETDPAHTDYLYETERLVTFPGKALHAKKNHLNRFFALYGDSYSYRPIAAPKDIDACLAFNDTWYALSADENSAALDAERAAVTVMLENFERLALYGGMLYVGDRLCAYTLASDNYDGAETLCVHVEKGLYDVVGVYPAIVSEFLKHVGASYRLVNREDDMGDEGLRRSKQSYQPIAFEEKYQVRITL